FPGKTASSPADLAMINAGYGDAFKHPTMVYKKVRIAREVKADHTNSRTFQEYAYEKQQNAKTNAAKQMRSQFDGNEAALEVIDSGIEQFNTAYGYYKPMIEEILILNGIEPTEENIASYSLQCFMADYLLVQIQDPESVKASLSGFGEYFVRGGYTESINNSKNPFVKYVLGTPVRLVDTAVKGAVGLYHSVENAGKAIGKYAWTNTSSNNTLVDFIQGDISWDEFNTRIAEDDKIRRSIMIGNCSGFADAVVGVVGGTLGSFQYIAYGETFYQDGTAALISAKDDAIVDTFDLSREDYMNGKSIATVEIIVATLVFALGKSMANTAAKNAAKQINKPKTEAAQLARDGKTPVIGKMKDLNKPGAIGSDEFRVADYLPDRGTPKLNWQQNDGVLRSIMNESVPIRDASLYPMENAGFLGAERYLLSVRGWIYRDGYWYPPQGGL
ncbi:MAG: hypothetical protein PHP22_12375, partial [Oscillospiraceae bacterium]|nr:hypothetical protein [Oscillospiraceae bacterium]